MNPKLVETNVHRLVNAVETRRPVPLHVVVVECVNHLMHLVEAINKEEWCYLVHVADGLYNFLESVSRHVGVKMEWSPIKHVARTTTGPGRQCHRNTHEEDASQEDIELLKAHLIAELLVGHGDDNIDEPLFRKEHMEELKLVVFSYHVPLVSPNKKNKLLNKLPLLFYVQCDRRKSF